jgi:heme exporter protein C
MTTQSVRWSTYAAPARLYPLAGRLVPWFAVPAAILFALGLYIGLIVAPTDFQQGDAYRVLFVHVPAAWTGMLLYLLLALYAALGWVLKTRASSMMSPAS